MEFESYRRDKETLRNPELIPLQEDLAEWINRTIGAERVVAEKFFDQLETGEILYRLGKVIQDRVISVCKNRIKAKLKNSCWENVKRGSFFARDNTENFIIFCRDFGVHENLMFESEDLVLRNKPRQVILCLLELSRLATKYSITPPQLIEFENEIEAEQLNSNCNDELYSDSGLSSIQSLPSKTANKISDESSSSVSSLESEESIKSNLHEIIIPPNTSRSDLDLKIENRLNLVQNRCKCSINGVCPKLKIHKIKNGTYKIADKTVYIRELKECHMMVRVGGGWETLEHYLSRHECCRVKVMNRTTSELSIQKLNNTTFSKGSQYLYIKSNYKPLTSELRH